ncbi:MAG: thymidylate kinase [Thermoproteota archaeon]
MYNAQPPYVICLFGPDGSGKSTLARLLRSYLYSRGVYAYISWFRGSHLFASVLARLLSRLAAFRGCSNPYYGITIPLKLRSLWILIEFSSLLPHYIFRRFLSLLHPLIGDRGILDFMVWIIVTLDHPKLLSSLLGGFLARLAAKERGIYVRADLAALHRRAVSMPLAFLVKESACYDVLAKYYASHIIDTTDKKPREAFGELLKCRRTL